MVGLVAVISWRFHFVHSPILRLNTFGVRWHQITANSITTTVRYMSFYNLLRRFLTRIHIYRERSIYESPCLHLYMRIYTPVELPRRSSPSPPTPDSKGLGKKKINHSNEDRASISTAWYNAVSKSLSSPPLLIPRLPPSLLLLNLPHLIIKIQADCLHCANRSSNALLRSRHSLLSVAALLVLPNASIPLKST